MHENALKSNLVFNFNAHDSLNTQYLSPVRTIHQDWLSFEYAVELNIGKKVIDMIATKLTNSKVTTLWQEIFLQA